MALDYKTLQAIVPELPPTREQYCPECRHSLTPPAVADDRSASHPWWWASMVVGIVLIFASGLHAVNDGRLIAQPQLLRHVIGLFSVEDGSQANQVFPDATAQLDHDLLLGIGGMALVLLAFGARVRQHLVQNRSGQVGIPGILLGMWGAGEAFIVALFRGSLLVFGYLFISELLAEKTLSLGLLDRTVGRTVGVIQLIAELVGAGYPRP
jgi:hypothetical protein